MSLIDEMMTACAFMIKQKVADGEGGFTTTWTDGAQFNATIVIENSTLAIVADSQQEHRTYRITTNRNISLEAGDVIKRLSDNATFKITSDAKDVQSPASSTLDIEQVTAERWELTT